MAQFIALLLCLSAVVFVNGQGNAVQSIKESNEVAENESESSGEELEKRSDNIIPQIGYLFKGYHVLEGNPADPKRFDPGFKAKIFKATYEQDKHTDDQHYKIPDSTEVVRKKTCTAGFSSEVVMTESDYQHSLSAKASVSGSGRYKIVKASFTGSAEYERTSRTLKSNTKSIIKTEAACVAYEARIETGTPPKFTSNFLEFVKRLGSGPEYYGQFLDTFGTHFVTVVNMGARYAKLQTITKENQEKLSKNGVDVRFAAEASVVALGSLKTDRQFKVSQEDKEKYEEKAESWGILSIGSSPPANGDLQAWMAESVSSPMPIYYELKNILEVFKPAFFPDGTVDYAKIRTELSQYMQTYCQDLKRIRLTNVECEGPPKGCRGGTQCSANAICTNNENSGDEDHLYNCKCKPGFHGDGKICQRELKWTPTDEIEQEDNRGYWGSWGTMDYCNGGDFAKGFILRAEKDQGSSDDTGANAVCLLCGDKEVCSNRGPWGDWSEPFRCERGSFITGWRQNVEDKLGWGDLKDDTALDNVEYKCRDFDTWEETGRIKGQATEWGRWSRFVECPRGQFICGINTKVESSGGDDTALNDIKHKCCKPTLTKKKAKANRYRKRKSRH